LSFSAYRLSRFFPFLRNSFLRWQTRRVKNRFFLESLCTAATEMREFVPREQRSLWIKSPFPLVPSFHPTPFLTIKNPFPPPPRSCEEPLFAGRRIKVPVSSSLMAGSPKKMYVPLPSLETLSAERLLFPYRGCQDVTQFFLSRTFATIR